MPQPISLPSHLIPKTYFSTSRSHTPLPELKDAISMSHSTWDIRDLCRLRSIYPTNSSLSSESKWECGSLSLGSWMYPNPSLSLLSTKAISGEWRRPPRTPSSTQQEETASQKCESLHLRHSSSPINWLAIYFCCISTRRRHWFKVLDLYLGGGFEGMWMPTLACCLFGCISTDYGRWFKVHLQFLSALL